MLLQPKKLDCVANKIKVKLLVVWHLSSALSSCLSSTRFSRFQCNWSFCFSNMLSFFLPCYSLWLGSSDIPNVLSFLITVVYKGSLSHWSFTICFCYIFLVSFIWVWNIHAFIVFLVNFCLLLLQLYFETSTLVFYSK
jgi:hypothetical protein